MNDPRQLPLFAWGDALRVARVQRARLRRRAAWLAAGIALVIATAALPPAPRLVWNASASAPIGLYAISPRAQPMRGDWVVAWAPPRPRRLAAIRHYLPANVPLVKRVAAVPGDRICAIGATITIDGAVRARRKVRDRAGRPMPWWHGCLNLRDGQMLLLNAPADSFDGRYFGPTGPGHVVGTATPLWVG